MKFLRYRKPSVRTMLGVTRVVRHVRKITGISTYQRFANPSRRKQWLLQKTGYYRPSVRFVRNAMKGKYPTPLGIKPTETRSGGSCLTIMVAGIGLAGSLTYVMFHLIRL